MYKDLAQNYDFSSFGKIEPKAILISPGKIKTLG